MIQSKYYVNYNGEVISLKEFARRTGVRYSTLQSRAQRGADLFSPISQYTEEKVNTRPVSTLVGGYTLDELAEIYTKFKGDEDELIILADFACLSRKSKAVIELRDQIIERLEQNRMEVKEK